VILGSATRVVPYAAVRMAHPPEHEKWHRAVLELCQIVVAEPGISEDGLVAALVARGHRTIDAEKLCLFVPSAFTWATMKRMGVKSFPSTYVVSDAAGNDVALPISGEHIFTAAQFLANETLTHGWSEELPRSTFEAVACRSAEMDALNQALDAKVNLAEAKLRPSVIHRFTAEAARGSG
jgi:hypothetical protein